MQQYQKAYVRYESGKIEGNVLIRDNPTERFRKNFNIGMEDGDMLLAQLELTASQYKILHLLFSQMEYGNLCYVTQSFISKVTGISQPNVSKHISKMVKLGLIIRENTERGHALRINSFLRWKGKRNADYKKLIAKDMELLKLPQDYYISDKISA
jgi:DNA-binding MarR family transcriptional regulator